MKKTIIQTATVIALRELTIFSYKKIGNSLSAANYAV